MQNTLPENTPYFITADAGYCHFLPQHIIVTTHTTFKQLPVSVDKKNYTTLIFGGLGVAFGTFLMVNFFIVGFTLMALLFFLGLFYATKVLVDIARYSTINNIPRKDIEKLSLHKPAFGYTYILIQFRNEKGTSSMRKIKLYDSGQNEANATRLLKAEGFL
jgi:hypothetical protein